MARPINGRPEYVGPLWSAWLRLTLAEAKITPKELGADIAATRDGESGGAYVRLVEKWLSQTATITPEFAFKVGQILQARLPWSSGLVTLYAAGYVGDYAMILHSISLSEKGLALTLAAAIPFLAGDLRRPMDAELATLYDAANRAAAWYAAAVSKAARFYGLEFESRSTKRRLHKSLAAIRSLMNDRDVSPIVAERYARDFILDWTDSLEFCESSGPLEELRALIAIQRRVRAKIEEERLSRALIADAINRHHTDESLMRFAFANQLDTSTSASKAAATGLGQLTTPSKEHTNGRSTPQETRPKERQGRLDRDHTARPRRKR